MRYFVDLRTDEILDETSEELQYLAPELYCEYCRGLESFIETWYVYEDKNIDVAYTKEAIESGLVAFIRNEVFSENKVKPIFIKRYTVPSDIFDRVINNL